MEKSSICFLLAVKLAI